MNREQKRAHLVERYGIFAEKFGFPPMVGRVFAWLLTSESESQTAEQIADGLKTSRSSVSTATNLLMQWGAIERTRIPGQRTNHYRLVLQADKGILQVTIQLICEEKKLAESALDLMKKNHDLRQQLKTYRDLLCFCEHEFPRLIEKWEKERNKK